MELLKHLKIEDLYRDSSVLVKQSRTGKGKRVAMNCLIRFRLRLMIDGVLIRSNYPNDPPLPLLDKKFEYPKLETPHDPENDEDLSLMQLEHRKDYIQGQKSTLYVAQMDQYVMP